MFDWDKFREPIRKWITDEGTIAPTQNIPAILQLLDYDGSLSLSRDSKRLQWGIRVPGDPSQTVSLPLIEMNNALFCRYTFGSML
jgi:methionyl-tRNA synthetase